MEFFHERLKEAMRRAGLTQTEIAKRLGIKQASVWEWLNKGYPNLKRLCQLCDMLNTTPNYLLGVVD